MLAIVMEHYMGVGANRGSWQLLWNITWVWGPLGGVGDHYGALHGCGGQ